ncbi:MAG: hypothetical protein ACRERY_13695 [Pseudomonas sp.]
MSELTVAENLSEERGTWSGLAREAFALRVFARQQPFLPACCIPHIHVGHKLAPIKQKLTHCFCY